MNAIITKLTFISIAAKDFIRVGILSCLLFTSFITVAQPANNDCSTATVIVPGTSCDYQQYTLSEATLTTGTPNAVCATNPKREVWFKTTVPSSGILAIQAKTNINPIIAITLYKGTCGSFTYYDCTNELEPGTGHLSMAID
ncbi:MAG: hypothetical protein AB8F74_22055, partial [Saprospiraceae bacterium]